MVPVASSLMVNRSHLPTFKSGRLFTLITMASVHRNPIDNSTVQHLGLAPRSGLSELVGGDVVAQAAGTTEFAITKPQTFTAGQPWTSQWTPVASFSEHPLCEPHVTIARGIAEDGHVRRCDSALNADHRPTTGAC